mmetsp:Transcript_22886/g.63537  ORF Transcript_22886/g.63537 Transcript_22886/m.63537 type:complete len:192 (-) Transcript_22886:1337-1912(-)|eukprot:CAMPEP_0117674966 /NCGR_PEP_ID=MMETSP0804-20121206/15341_1 /TAXON_ID=1074897 /ORGANISM="Tetraselmis astigmatica, Strain CCMP880" /LENGTH=191 /DNA_ID=CAMNT_0005483913 /DNA_START=51 /DNA_END=626 /DNA_ORIENTATION=+
MLSLSAFRCAQSLAALPARAFSAAASIDLSAIKLQAARSWDDGVADSFKATNADEIFKGKKVVLFGVPGAFTGVCSQAHVPGFVNKLADFKAKGVNTVACVSVNDPYTMNAWQQKLGVASDQIAFFGDSDASFAKVLGVEVDLNAAALGPALRSNRYSLLIEDGKITQMNVEDGPSDLKVSDADTLLSQMA